MERVRFCRHCGELLEDQWMHCPWCGNETLHGSLSWDTIVDDSLVRTETELIKGRMGRLNDISGKLDALELELDVFLAGKI
jgi:RNA polymerase subunit RPABC4/transcription elongation factor Spt4